MKPVSRADEGCIAHKDIDFRLDFVVTPERYLAFLLTDVFYRPLSHTMPPRHTMATAVSISGDAAATRPSLWPLYIHSLVRIAMC
jgi:hypothetical protein